MVQSFLASHAGKGALGVCVAALMLAWPPACAWIASACLLGWSITELKAAFKDLDDA